MEKKMVSILDNINSDCLNTDDMILKKFPNILISHDNKYTLLRYSSSNIKDLSEIESECRSVLLLKNDKNKYDLIYSLYDKIRINDEAKKYIKENKIPNSRLVFEQCYEGTLIVIFWCHLENKWRIHTRSCLDADKSKWGKE